MWGWLKKRRGRDDRQVDTGPGPQEADSCLEIRAREVYCKVLSGLTLAEGKGMQKQDGAKGEVGR